MAMAKIMALLGYNEFTVHGFRSTFKDWGGRLHHVPTRTFGGRALSHCGRRGGQAYRRSDALELRRQLMEAWSRYCDVIVGENIVPMIA